MIDNNKIYDLNDALTIIKSKNSVKFTESIDVSFNLSIAPKNKNFTIKGYSVLPYGNSKYKKIALFSVENSFDTKSCDDFIVLTEKDIYNINKKNIFFDLLITTPSSMIKLTKVSKILSIKNLMPDIKYGTISSDVFTFLNLVKKNYVRFKSDKNNVVNVKIGDIKIDNNKLFDNLSILINDIKKQKPKDCKVLDFKNLYISSTMGSSFRIDLKSFFN